MTRLKCAFGILLKCFAVCLRYNTYCNDAGLRADFGYWLLALDREALRKMEHYKLGLEGSFEVRVVWGLGFTRGLV